jgi:fatty acid desaturase
MSDWHGACTGARARSPRMTESMSTTESAPIPASAPRPPEGRGYYKEHMGTLAQRLRQAVPTDELRDFHERSGVRHLLYAARQAFLYAACTFVLIRVDDPWIWVPVAALQGTVILSFIILLHEVVHETVFRSRRPGPMRLLGLLYALPSTISASQFTRWHLDHHRNLGSAEEDPKRAHLSPKRNARWYKALYMTAGLFAIYMKASSTEARKYPPELRRTIAREKIANFLLHGAFVAALWSLFGGEAVLRAYVVPLFVFFPPAFMLNRLGQHYWIDSEDPAKWSTRVDGSPLVRLLFLNSNHHIEHHYFPSVPLYRLPALNRRLRSFWKEIGHANRTYPALLWGWFVKNGSPHSDWDDLA